MRTVDIWNAQDRSARAVGMMLILLGIMVSPARADEVTFRYEPGGSPSSVSLAGSFNSWDAAAQPMADPDGDGVFEVVVDLEPGTYQYKFVVDGNWFEDPNAGAKAEDGFGGQNSIVDVGGAATAAPEPAASSSGDGSEGTRTFRFAPPGGASAVFIAGSFNEWNPEEDAMSDPDGDGTWEIALELPEGEHQYKFVADGNWHTDESAEDFVDDGFGGRNSIVRVGAGTAAAGTATATTAAAAATSAAAGAAASPGTASPGTQSGSEVTFRYQPVIGGVNQVYIAGSFNDWSADRDPMQDDDGDGIWEITLSLPDGEHSYKFVVDGTWITDENAEEFVDDGYGGQNSMVRVGGGEHGGSLQAEEGLFDVGFAFTPSGVPGSVALAGTFNEWSTTATPLSDQDGDGTYEVTLVLPAGTYQYKFVVDGSWFTDESAADFADDGFGGRNSILTVDSRMSRVEMNIGDGALYIEGIAHNQSLAERNLIEDDQLLLRARAYRGDYESVEVAWNPGDGFRRTPMVVFSGDASLDHLEATLEVDGEFQKVEYAFVYEDGEKEFWLGPHGFREAAGTPPSSTPSGFEPFLFDSETMVVFRTPDWIRDGVIYQIFPDRFYNGDSKNDPKFKEEYYEGRARLPRVGKHNGEYYHHVKDWYDIDGLTKSPYRSDGKPDWFSFYGGDIQGVIDKLPYLEDLGVTVLYFNPVFQARSNHKYDTADYEKVDPHFGENALLREMVDQAHARGIKVILDTVFNHCGDAHWAFQDCVEKGSESEYWDWFEWKKWPLPTGDPSTWNAEEYYECWWGFGSLPDFNFDLKNTKSTENNTHSLEDAEVNQVLVDHLLAAVRDWLVELDVDGFRLDVPNEVPFWFWRMFAEEVRKAKPDTYIVTEVWSDASEWISPELVDATMNYKYFRDPVVKWIAQGNGTAGAFDRELAPGRFVYPVQAQQAMMNLLDSHDTVRFRTQAKGDHRRLMLATTFQMTYVGAPHIYYGNEIAMEGGSDPDCRRPFRWDWMEQAERKETLDHFKKMIAMRKSHEALRRGSFQTLIAEGPIYAYARSGGGEVVVCVLNNSEKPVELSVPLEKIEGAGSASFEGLLDGGKTQASGGELRVSVGPLNAGIWKTKIDRD